MRDEWRIRFLPAELTHVDYSTWIQESLRKGKRGSNHFNNLHLITGVLSSQVNPGTSGNLTGKSG